MLFEMVDDCVLFCKTRWQSRRHRASEIWRSIGHVARRWFRGRSKRWASEVDMEWADVRKAVRIRESRWDGMREYFLPCRKLHLSIQSDVKARQIAQIRPLAHLSLE